MALHFDECASMVAGMLTGTPCDCGGREPLSLANVGPNGEGLTPLDVPWVALGLPPLTPAFEDSIMQTTGPLPETKETNPKDAVGVRKAPFSTVPMGVVAEIGLGMLEGARKYGRHNYRVAGIRNSVYYDAAMRHLTAWWEGEDADPDSGLSHITKALCTLVVLRDAMMNGKATDDRPPPLPEGWLRELNAKAGEIIDRHPEPKASFFKVALDDKLPPNTWELRP